MMTYPPAPWNLYGNGLQTLNLVDLERAKTFVPPEFEIVSVLPGKTVGGLYLAKYDAESTFLYHELILVAAMVRYQGTLGGWVSHIYVDHPDSLAGGREIWGLPKEMAEFTWKDGYAKVTQGSTTLCEVQFGQWGLPLSLGGKSNIRGNVLSCLAENLLVFTGEFQAGLKWMQCDLQIPAESPFSGLALAHPWITLQMQNLHLTAHAPSVLGQRSAP